MDDVTLTFDEEPFNNAMKNMTASMSQLMGSIDNLAGKVGDTIDNTVGKTNKVVNKSKKDTANFFDNFSQLVSKLTRRIVGMGVAFLGVKKALSFMPEIGRAFSMAGSVITKNLLWPLRKEILPILQKMLDWVRDHRAMFVRWGTYLVSIFRVIKSIVVGFIELLKNMWERLSAGIERIFGKTVKSMSQLANIVIFKIAMIAEFIMMLLKPVFKWLVDMFITAIGYIKDFVDAFIKGLGDLMPDLEDMGKSLKRIWSILGGVNKRTSAMSNLFKDLGTVLGMIVGPIIRGVGQLLDNLATTLEDLGLAFKLAKVALSGGTTAQARIIIKKREELEKSSTERAQKRWGRQGNAWSQGFKDISSRQVIGTSSQNELNKAVEERVKRELNLKKVKGTSSVVNNTPINITVNEAKDAKASGEEVNRAVTKSLKDAKVLSGN